MNTDKLRLLKSKADDALHNAGNLLEQEPVKQLIHELQVYQEELEAQKYELEEKQIQIEELAAKFSNIFDLAPVGYLLLNDQDEILEANREAHKLLRIPPHVHVSKRITSYITTADSIKSFLQWIVGRDDNLLDLKIRSNPDMWINLRKTKLDDLEATTLVSVVDISEQVERHTKLIKEANYDTLTHLPNRSLLSDRLTQAMSRAKRLKTVMSVIFIDLDGFKEIND